MQPLVLQNTLFTPSGIETLSSMPIETDVYPSLTELLTKFQDIKKFASEIHTEIHLVKPMLKLLGFTYESKPKFFENHVKDPDVALFPSEDDRVKSSKLWGTKEYYDNVLSILVLKRYGRNLHEGISGFFLEFENRIPLYQIMYLLKKSHTPWGVLTNGRYWILIKRPVAFEQKLIEIDLEVSLLSGEEKSARLFFNTFSLLGLKNTLPKLLEHERETLIKHLKDKKRATRKMIGSSKKRFDIYPRIREVYRELFPDDTLPTTEAYMKNYDIKVENNTYQKTGVLNEYDRSDICSYLFADSHAKTGFDIEDIIVNQKKHYTKEDLLSLRILDMTPGFGNITTQLLEGLAYLSFVLPYTEKNSFISEWEDEKSLKKYILDHNLYGIERSHICYDALQNMLNRRYGSPAHHYKPGNPLIGITLKDIGNIFDTTKQGSLFGRNPKEALDEFREMYRLYFSLSNKIKEDVKIREEIEAKLKVYTSRIRGVMDATTATFFTRDIDVKKVEDLLYSLEADESTWTIFRQKGWFTEFQHLAVRNGFFHMELEFPILLSNAYDFIFVQPALNYSWEDEIPVGEATKAFIKKGMAFLKQDGKFVVLLDEDGEALLSDLQKSKKYAVEAKKGFFILTKRNV
jgi:hypothetical protein